MVEARLGGMSVSEIVALYKVDDNCVYRWVTRYEATGSYAAKKRGHGRKPKITDMKKFEVFAQVHAHSTLSRMKQKWEEDVSEMCLSRTLRRLGWR